MTKVIRKMPIPMVELVLSVFPFMKSNITNPMAISKEIESMKAAA